MINGILFDLDGTLIDTAPDMGGALNNLLAEEGFAPLPMSAIRPLVSKGGLTLTRLGFADKVAEEAIEPLRQRFLQHYRAVVADQSHLFAGMEAVLSNLQQRSIPWGIVTNKPEWLALPLLEQLDLLQNCKVVIGGDTLAEKKPHPLPLLTAAQQAKINPTSCLYVGDDERDIIAGRAAGMGTVIAAYGYIESTVDISDWNSDWVIENPLQLLELPPLQ